MKHGGHNGIRRQSEKEIIYIQSEQSGNDGRSERLKQTMRQRGENWKEVVTSDKSRVDIWNGDKEGQARIWYEKDMTIEGMRIISSMTKQWDANE